MDDAKLEKASEDRRVRIEARGMKDGVEFMKGSMAIG